MPERKTIRRAKQKAAEGKRPTTQAGEFVREEMEHVREDKHGARSAKQAIAIGLSKARRAGVPLPPPKKGKTSEATRIKAARDYQKGQTGQSRTESSRRSRATSGALRREGRGAASHRSLARQAKRTTRRRAG
ncbi:MAG TPA: DUF6496 domain-containing protein [Nitrospira sp.]|nr:DUF6496 domain-containing protein [Nitrospira sp.]